MQADQLRMLRQLMVRREDDGEAHAPVLDVAADARAGGLG